MNTLFFFSLNISNIFLNVVSRWVDQDVGGGDGGIIAKTLKTRGANCRSSKTINFRKFPAKMINFRKCRANPRKYQISSVQNETKHIFAGLC